MLKISGVSVPEKASVILSKLVMTTKVVKKSKGRQKCPRCDKFCGNQCIYGAHLPRKIAKSFEKPTPGKSYWDKLWCGSN